MSRLKIISQTLPTRCEICHQTDQFDAETGYCSRCFVVIVEENKLINSSITQDNTKILPKRKKLSKPREVTLQIDDKGLTIAYNTFDKDTIFGLILFLLINSVIIYAGFLWIGLGLALPISYALLATILNKRVIKVDKDKISVWEGPLPMGINKEVKTNIIKQLFYRKTTLGDYELKAILLKDNAIDILPNIITKKIAKYLKSQIEKYLNIPEQAVPKQLKK
ncbi:MAG: hypothetical protein WAQ98_21945 [Blastocatellia bacterium]